MITLDLSLNGGLRLRLQSAVPPLHRTVIEMQKATDSEYFEMKAFLAYYVERYFLNREALPPEKWPMVSLEALEEKGMKTALKGLRQAINDCVERSFHFDHAEGESLDSERRKLGVITLSELRRRYSKSCAVSPSETLRPTNVANSSCRTRWSARAISRSPRRWSERTQRYAWKASGPPTALAR